MFIFYKDQKNINFCDTQTAKWKFTCYDMEHSLEANLINGNNILNNSVIWQNQYFFLENRGKNY